MANQDNRIRRAEDGEQDRVAQIEFAVVHPDHRGHGLEYRMADYIENQPEVERFNILMGTIAPDNAPSLKSALKAGYQVVTTKVKYGGLLRNIMLKRLP